MHFCRGNKTITMKTILSTAAATIFEQSSSVVYIGGAIVAALILGYLLYTLIKPDKF